MSRDAHDANWRLCERVIDRLLANLDDELVATAPANLNVEAPPAEAFHVLPSAAAVRRFPEMNQPVLVFIHPSSRRTRTVRSQGPTTAPRPSKMEITIAVHVLEEAGATDYVAGWKTLSTPEREYRRSEALLGAIQNIMDSKSRGPTQLEDATRVADDILQVEFVDSGGDENYKLDARSPGTWGSSRWLVTQIINVPVQQ